MDSPLVKEAQKNAIRQFDRRIFVFSYPSDGLNVKGLISFVSNAHEHPSLVFLRGGNRIFDLSNPACDFHCAEQYTVIAPMYRGGVSEGNDEDSCAAG